MTRIRTPVHMTRNMLRFKASKWLRKNKDVSFDIPLLTQQLGLDPNYRIHYQRVYNQVIKYWRKKAIEKFREWKESGLLPSNKNRYELWDIFTFNCNQNDFYIFLYDWKRKCFMQPGFDKLERMDKIRLEKQWKGICSIIEEMQVYDAHLLINGTQKPITELIDAGKKFQNLLKISLKQKE